MNQMKHSQRSLNANLARPLHEKRSFLKPCIFVEVKSIITPFLEQLFVVLACISVWFIFFPPHGLLFLVQGLTAFP